MRRFLAASATALLVILVFMVVFSALGAPSGDTVAAKLADLRAADGAAVAALSYARLRRDREEAGVSLVAGLLLVAAYAPLSAVAYVSQYTVLHWLLGRDQSSAALWFFGNEKGIPLTLDLLGYAVWGVGTLLLISPLLTRRWGASHVLACSLLASAVTSLLAFALHAAGNSAATPLSTVSGMLIVPAAVAALFVTTGGDDRMT